MKNIDFIYQNDEYALTFDDNNLKSIVDNNAYFKATNQSKKLVSKTFDMPYLSGSSKKLNKNQIEFEFDLPDDYITYKKWVQTKPISVIMDSLISFINYIQVNDNFIPIVHPDNLLVDGEESIWIVNRFVKNNKVDIFKDVKTLVVSSFSKLSFSDLANGNSRELLNDDQNEIFDAKNYQELITILDEERERYFVLENKKKTTVSKRRWNFSRILMFFGLLATVGLAGLLIYQNSHFSDIRNKYQVSQLLNTSLSTYDDQKRDQRIQKLLKQPKVISMLNYDEKRKISEYLVADSDDFSYQEKMVTLNNFADEDKDNFTRDENFIMFWLMMGQENYEKAFNYASLLKIPSGDHPGDLRLKQISMNKLINQIENDKKLSNKQRVEKIESYKKDIDAINAAIEKNSQNGETNNQDGNQ